MVTYQGALNELTSCLNTNTLLDLAHRFSETYKNLAKTSTEHFLITPVTALPTGKEHGKFLAIDVGGSNLRVGFVELAGESAIVDHGNHDTEIDVSSRIKRSHDKSWPIGEHLKMDQPEDLFKWIGDCMAEVIREAIGNASIPTDREILLGVTFSFPMAQSKLSEATVLPMGKGFAVTTDLDLGEMLLAGYARHCSTTATESAADTSRARTSDPLPSIRVTAITNDTVATFVSLTYAVKAAPNSRVAMGLIVGTGTNATVPLRPSYLHPEKQSQVQGLAATDTVVINTEWTIRGTDKPLDDLGIKTKWDRILDKNSDAPGFQPFEYMTSGRYLGEIVRLAFVDLMSAEVDPLSCNVEKIPEDLQHKYSLPTRFLSEVVARLDNDIHLTNRLQSRYQPYEIDIDNFDWTPKRLRLLRNLARAVQQRSSALIAAASVGLLDCVGDISLRKQSTVEPDPNDEKLDKPADVEELVIAYTGSTISQYPHWLDDCQACIDKLVAASATHPKKRVILKEALDGGIIGAGVLAGMGSMIL
ncbi:hexokinase family protein-like protein [Macroventuria anomochaeta]|uniref:Hexokinase family protein-like protein n=1 Tax=Macroventuria anomochaeta TaxID=301207 RepID=A0ACB6SCZ0_9PLEO|nr:hexokinase family protein-like protein [Macroventuria anomochaeta]KAF2631208.1 hexokinase family protein-like protein [Macroventuria anomochaeta]